jgi:hypothetical protein
LVRDGLDQWWWGSSPPRQFPSAKVRTARIAVSYLPATLLALADDVIE